ncbi:hypothetical protein QF006_000009 [Pantoea agglomerans]|jgi:hypothetical protein|nr:hypothetical protein [Pantoea agglomerans]
MQKFNEEKLMSTRHNFMKNLNYFVCVFRVSSGGTNLSFLNAKSD